MNRLQPLHIPAAALRKPRGAACRPSTPSNSRDILARPDAARTVTDMDMPGFRLHPLKGELKVFGL